MLNRMDETRDEGDEFVLTYEHVEPHAVCCKACKAARAELVGCRDRVKQAEATRFWAEAEMLAAQARVEQLQQALERYGRHAPACTFLQRPWLGRAGVGGTCDCGFAAALAGSHPEPPQQSADKSVGAPDGDTDWIYTEEPAPANWAPCLYCGTGHVCAASAALPSPAPEPTDAEGLSASKLAHLTELRRLAEAATPGPWHADSPDGGYLIARLPNRRAPITTQSTPADIDADAEFIAAASPDVVIGLIDDLRATDFDAFVAGFKESGEGWNGEYPSRKEEALRDELREPFTKRLTTRGPSGPLPSPAQPDRPQSARNRPGAPDGRDEA